MTSWNQKWIILGSIGYFFEAFEMKIFSKSSDLIIGLYIGIFLSVIMWFHRNNVWWHCYLLKCFISDRTQVSSQPISSRASVCVWSSKGQQPSLNSPVLNLNSVPEHCYLYSCNDTTAWKSFTRASYSCMDEFTRLAENIVLHIWGGGGVRGGPCKCRLKLFYLFCQQSTSK
jgi:hypothetical protein